MATGPSTTTNPYLLALEPNVTITSIITTGDSLSGSTSGVFGGVPDGLGAFDNGDGTVTVLVNHEIGATAGVLRDHGAIGSYVDRLVIDKASLQVLSGDDAMKQVYLWNATSQQYDLASPAFNRFCSGDLADTSAYYNAATGLGTQTRIYLTGEEAGNEGRPMATILTGADAGKAYEIAALGNQSFENLVANPFAQNKTIIATTDDTAGGQVYIYVGDKQASGTELQKAGLDAGTLYGIKATFAAEASTGTSLNTTFTLEAVGADGNVKNMTGAQIQNASVADGITGFLRPEDAAWDPEHPNVLYFVTTNAFNSPSRLWKATFDDITDPAKGGKLEAVLDGTEGQQMFDNITVANGKVILQEDPGNQSYVSKVYEYDIATDTLTSILKFDPAQFTPGLPGFITQDEESSGVLDVSSIWGDADTRAYLLDAQVHATTGDPRTVEKGQLLLMTVDAVKDGGNGDDLLNGDGTANVIKGFNGNDTIRAGSGDDVLWGNNGNDVLDGMAGNDVLIGGRGDDRLTGGAGNDTFDYSRLEDGKKAPAGNDTITDFTHGQDVILLAEGVWFKGETHADYNNDGVLDTRVTLTSGGTLTLLSLAQVQDGDFATTSGFGLIGLDRPFHDLALV
ncbi:alkaline phosphatase PhoX [Novosphingobium huizhouense]|uniref:alkaline phosphatase PhoX n=1 Tax=Novosphingobium huizhouense TaxID=2866625 RepID=UPI001CD82F2A|nr:alkaline phosphatase PhoX [Novosphingobium huizhouense]